MHPKKRREAVAGVIKQACFRTRGALSSFLTFEKNMANPFFQFKKFTVWHDRCAMKVGTDGVLLGVWADTEEAGRILDVGTGTGLIALLSAQRSKAWIDAIDIDEAACLQAKENVRNSPFADRIRVIHASLEAYRRQTERRYDWIVSNPPYFIDSLKCPDAQRALARHTDSLPLQELIRDSRALLTPNGRLALIWPYDQKDRLLKCCVEEKLFISKETVVIPRPGACPKRCLVELALEPVATPFTTSLTIEIERHRYTPEFIRLVQPFYLYL